MLDLATGLAAPQTVGVIPFTGGFGRRDARLLLEQVRGQAVAGMRWFVVDLTAADPIAEGPLVLALLSVRGELRRIDGRLVVAAEPGLAERLAGSLRLDDRLGATCTTEEALADLENPANRPTVSGATRCDRCATTWHRRFAGLNTLVGTSCPRCGGHLSGD